LGRPEPQPFREIKRHLEAAGFIEASQKGSHVKLVRRLGAVVETPVGTLRSILGQAHISPDDWEELC